jgi:endonuclease YncB( thermonuclease family)
MVPTILTEGGLQGERQAYSTPQSFGSQVGDAIEGAGNQINRSTANFAQIADQKRSMNNAQWVGESIEQEKNYVSKWMADANNNSKESFPEDLQALYKDRLTEYEKNSPNADARKDFRLQFSRFMSSRYESAVNTAAGNKISNMGVSVDGMINNTVDAYRIARNIPNVDANLQLLEDIDGVSGHIDSMFGKIAPNMAKQFKDKMIKDAVYAAMDYSPDLARKILDKGNIEGQSRHAIENQIDQASKDQNAVQSAQFDEFRKNHLTMVDTGKKQDKIDLVLYQSNYSRDQAYAYKLRDDALIDIYNNVNEFKTKVAPFSANEQLKELSNLQSKVGSNEGTAYRDEKTYELAAEQVAKNVELIRKDPVSYLSQNNPAIKRTRDQIAAMPEDSRKEAMKPLVDLIVKYQGTFTGNSDDGKMYLNIPRNQVGILTKGEAEQAAAQVNQGSPKEALNTINGILSQYPEEYQATVFNDLVKLPGEKGIKGEYWAASMNKNAWWIDDYIGVLQNAESIKKATSDKVSDFEKAVDANANWLQFANPIAGDNFQRQNVVESFRNGVLLYAMGLAQKGATPDAAVKMSIDRLLNEEQGLTAVNGKPVMVPRNQGDNQPYRSNEEIRDIGHRLNLALKFVDPKEIGTKDEFGRNLFPALNTAGNDETKSSALRDAILAKGTFQTTPDGKAAVLYYDDGINHFEMRDKSGRAFVVKFDQLPKFEQYTLGMEGYGGAPQIRGLEHDPLAPVITGGPKYRDGRPVGVGRPIDFVYSNDPYKTNWPSMPPWLSREGLKMQSREGVNKFTMDGDTLIDEQGTKHRLLGINAPEVSHPEHGKMEAQPLSIESSNAVYQLTSGKPIRIESSGKKDKYGRTLSTIYYKENGKEINLNEELLRRGLAKPY